MSSLLTEWNKAAKSINVHVLAISALVRKLALLRSPFGIAPELVQFARTQVAVRLSEIFVAFVRDWKLLVGPAFYAKLRIAQFANQATDEELHELVGILLDKIDSLMDLDLVKFLEFTLAHTEKLHGANQVALFVQEHVEAKLTLPIVQVGA